MKPNQVLSVEIQVHVQPNGKLGVEIDVEAPGEDFYARLEPHIERLMQTSSEHIIKAIKSGSYKEKLLEDD